MIKMTKKQIRLILVVSGVAILLELGMFNFSFFSKLVEPGLRTNVTYQLDDFYKSNWIENGTTLISGIDPVLTIYGVNNKVEDLIIQAQSDTKIPYVQLFYSDKFSGDNLITIREVTNNTFKVHIGKEINDIRIHLGDDAGLVLRRLAVTINPMKLEFSVSRVIAVMLIWYGMKFLFSLQSSPDYGIKVTNEKEIKLQKENQKWRI